MSVELRGVDQLSHLAKELRRIGDRELTKAAKDALKEAIDPTVDIRDSVKADIRRFALRNLPQHGGLNRRVAGTKLTTQVRTTDRFTGVRITARARLDRIDKGTVRHPVFGNRQRFVSQPVTPGFFTTPTEAARPKVTRRVQAAMDAIARKINKI